MLPFWWSMYPTSWGSHTAPTALRALLTSTLNTRFVGIGHILTGIELEAVVNDVEQVLSLASMSQSDAIADLAAFPVMPQGV